MLRRNTSSELWQKASKLMPKQETCTVNIKNWSQDQPDMKVKFAMSFMNVSLQCTDLGKITKSPRILCFVHYSRLWNGGQRGTRKDRKREDRARSCHGSILQMPSSSNVATQKISRKIRFIDKRKTECSTSGGAHSKNGAFSINHVRKNRVYSTFTAMKVIRTIPCFWIRMNLVLLW